MTKIVVFKSVDFLPFIAFSSFLSFHSLLIFPYSGWIAIIVTEWTRQIGTGTIGASSTCKVVLLYKVLHRFTNTVDCCQFFLTLNIPQTRFVSSFDYNEYRQWAKDHKYIVNTSDNKDDVQNSESTGTYMVVGI